MQTCRAPGVFWQRCPENPVRIDLVTLFPEWFASPLQTGLFGKAQSGGLVDVHCHNPRDLATDRHHTVDDRPYGGGPGMVLMADPLVRLVRGLPAQGRRRMLVMSASGRPFTQAMARELAETDQLVIVCGRYEGIDARVERLLPLEAISVGEAVLNGGEAAALLVIEAVSRLIPGFMGKEASGEDESFSAGLLEYPHFTRPESYEGLEVPRVLREGDHGRILRWRREQSLATTWLRRPEMLDTAPLSGEDITFLRELEPPERLGRNLYVALVHHPVFLERPASGREKSGTTSLTNLDVHDIAQCSRSYGAGGYFVVTPLKDQQRLLRSLVEHWTTGAGGRSNPDRAEALSLVRGVDDLEAAIAGVTALAGQRPLVIGTSARPEGGLSPALVRERLRERPVLLVLGTGHGLAPQALALCDAVLRPLRWFDRYNHLPVRGAAAVILDRILGDRY